MSFLTDIAGDFAAVVDGLAAATVVLTPDSGSSTNVSITNAWAEPIGVDLTMYGGAFLGSKGTIINVPDSELNPATNGRRIQPDDRITFNSISHKVISVDQKTLRTRWRCVCVEVPS